MHRIGRHGRDASARRKHLRSLDIRCKPKPAQQQNELIPQIDLPRIQTMPRRCRERMVIVVPAFTH